MPRLESHAMTRLELDATHDLHAASWVAGSNGHAAFPIQNLPLGVFRHAGGEPCIGAAIGDFIVDLPALARLGLADLPQGAFDRGSCANLNAYFALPASERRASRHAVFAALRAQTDQGARASSQAQAFLRPASECEMQLPAIIGDYTDFYAGIHHARNGGVRMGRQPPISESYQAMPVAYHGRVSTICCAPRGVRRPRGQYRSPEGRSPRMALTRKLDYELEMGARIGTGNAMGRPVPVNQAEELLAGLCLLNDLSARDIQGWEMAPLGPFLSKNFGTVISPWVVTSEALAPFRRPRMAREAEAGPLLEYLEDPHDARRGGFAIELQVELSTRRMREQGEMPARISLSHSEHLYWTFAQMIAHHTAGGCNLRPGDLLGSGTISAPERSGYGSLAEITDDGKAAITLPCGENRTYLEDGDQVTFTATASADGYAQIGFGSSTVEILPGDEDYRT